MGPEDRGRALNASVLVLNRHYQAVRVITARHSFILLFREVAEVINMHESTVSRVTNEKFVQTPRGVLPLKFFFSSGLSTADGEDVSARGIRDRIAKGAKVNVRAPDEATAAKELGISRATLINKIRIYGLTL